MKEIMLEPDPAGAYFILSGLRKKCTWIRGNHNQWLANYIKNILRMALYYAGQENTIRVKRK